MEYLGPEAFHSLDQSEQWKISEWASTGLAFLALLVPLSTAGSCSSDGIEKRLTEEISHTHIFSNMLQTRLFHGLKCISGKLEDLGPEAFHDAVQSKPWKMSEWASTGLAFLALLAPLVTAGSCSSDRIEKHLTEEISHTHTHFRICCRHDLFCGLKRIRKTGKPWT